MHNPTNLSFEIPFPLLLFVWAHGGGALWCITRLAQLISLGIGGEINTASFLSKLLPCSSPATKTTLHNLLYSSFTPLTVSSSIFTMARKSAIMLAVACSTLLTTAATIDKRIAGGEAAQNGDIPCMVSIQNERGQHECGGSLLDDTTVLTAAHCLGSSHSIRAGTLVNLPPCTLFYSLAAPLASRGVYCLLRG